MDRRVWGLLLGVGLELAGLVVVAAYVGDWLEARYKLGGWGTAGLVAAAFVGWLVHLVVVLKYIEKLDSDKGETK